jgi:hypothetical protein
MRLRRLQPHLDDFDVVLGCRDSLLRLLLKTVQNVNHSSKSHGVDPTKGLAIVILDDF